MPSSQTILGLDIGGTKSAVVLGDFSGKIHDHTSFPTLPERGFEIVYGQLCENIETILKKSASGTRAPGAISVSIGGPLNIEKGIILSPPNLPGWVDIPLKEMLQDRFSLPVHIEHDGNAGALAEWYFGAAQGAQNVIFLTMGTGFGGGLILNGRLYRGTSSLAGEVGHIRLASRGPVAFGKTGSWEAFCAGSGIARLAAYRFPKRWKKDQITTRELAKLASQGDQDALSVFELSGRFLGKGLAILMDVLNPEIIVIGSLAFRLGDLVLAPARNVLKREALPGAQAVCKIVPAKLGEKLGDVASLCAAIYSKQ